MKRIESNDQANMNRKQEIGIWGESIAVEYINKEGWHILQRNYRTPYGEIDIIARKAETIIFVEVKTRTGSAFGYPEEAVTQSKCEHIIQSAQYYLQQFPEDEGNIRLDVIAIRKLANKPEPEVNWFQNAIS